MFSSLTKDQLETLKIILTLTGTGATLFFGILGTAFETHAEKAIIKNGKEEKKRRVNRWFYVAVIGMILSSLITGSSFFLDKHINKLSDLEDDVYKAHQDSLSNRLDSSLKMSLALTKDFKIFSENTLVRLDTNVNRQNSNLVIQTNLLNKTTTLVAHPFYPFRFEAVLKLKPKLTNEEQKGWNEIKDYLLKSKSSINKPPDFSIETFGQWNDIYYGGNKPFDIFDTLSIDPQIRRLRDYFSHILLPQLTFSLFSAPVNQNNKNNEVYSFSAGNNILGQNLLKQVFPMSNCKLGFSINYLTDTITFVYSAPTSYHTSAPSFVSLYDIRQGYFTISFKSQTQNNYRLERAILYCGSQSEVFSASFEIDDLIYSESTEKEYMKTIASLLKLNNKKSIHYHKD